MVLVFEFTVRFDPLQLNPPMFNVDAPNVRVLAVLPLEVIEPDSVTVCPFVLIVPAVWLNEVAVKASAKDHVAPLPLKVPVPKFFPLEVMLFVPVVPANVQLSIVSVIPAAIVTCPTVLVPTVILGVDVPARVPVKPVKLIDLQTRDPLTVQVFAPLLASKNTSSEAVGTPDPPPPPEVVDHLVPAVASHVAVPPTQYLLAI